jgi:hypothetical protein
MRTRGQADCKAVATCLCACTRRSWRRWRRQSSRSAGVDLSSGKGLNGCIRQSWDAQLQPASVGGKCSAAETEQGWRCCLQRGTALMGGVGGDGRCVIECPQYCHRDGLPWWAGCMVRAVHFCQRRVSTRPLGDPHAARIEAHRASGGGERGGATVVVARGYRRNLALALNCNCHKADAYTSAPR